MANSCTNEGICHSCGIAGHQAKDCTARQLPPGYRRLCNNCYKQGHFAADFTNEKACNNCRKTGGVHASMVGSLHPTPVATLPFLSPHSAVVAFCEGILKYGTNWEALREELAAQQITMTLDEVRERMRTVLSLTDITRFPIPKTLNAVIFVAATDDGYIPKHSVLELQNAWPGSEMRWVTGGHVSSFILHNDEFRRAVVDGMDRVEWKESW